VSCFRHPDESAIGLPLGRRVARAFPIRALARDGRAATGLEYGLIASMVAVLAVLLLTNLNIDFDQLGSSFSHMVSNL
jgi:Flp pilus assembly pilin Flp